MPQFDEMGELQFAEIKFIVLASIKVDFNTFSKRFSFFFNKIFLVLAST